MKLLFMFLLVLLIEFSTQLFSKAIKTVFYPDNTPRETSPAASDSWNPTAISDVTLEITSQSKGTKLINTIFSKRLRCNIKNRGPTKYYLLCITAPYGLVFTCKGNVF